MFDLHPGFTITPAPKKVGDDVRINYYGLLVSAGADQIWLHTGYGTGNWQRIYDHPMSKTANGWEQSLVIDEKGQFNFCFKDSADHWDNNNGMNWSYRID